MFPEGQGRPNGAAKLAAKVPMINALFVNSKANHSLPPPQPVGAHC